MMRYSRYSALFTIAAMTYAQQVGQNNTPTTDTPTFSITRQLKIESVLVKDKSGNPVEGLTAKGLHGYRRRRAAGDQVLRISEAG
jgi:hypothetical protein